MKRRRTPPLKIGDIVRIRDHDMLFDSYDEWAKKYNLTKFTVNLKSNSRVDLTGKVGSVIARGNHLDYSETNIDCHVLYAIDIMGIHEVIGDRDSFELIERGEDL